LKSLPIALRKEARDLIDALGDEPAPAGSQKLRGHEDYYRLAFGSGGFRIVYRVRPEKVIIERVRPRGRAYDGL
jgi:mRNA-degrading endonuclease RelE of RelBE toxin-antitoxin system